MRTIFKTLSFLALALGCMSCNEKIQDNNNEHLELRTKAGSSERRFHWRCPLCHYENGGWASSCIQCPGQYSGDMADLIISLWLREKTAIKTITVPGNWNGDEPAPGSIQISDNIFTAIAPSAWYETSATPKYYDQYTKGIHVLPVYKEAFDYAWYKVTHILYPGVHKKSDVKAEYDKWVAGSGRNLKGDNAQGLKDGTKAAITAFINT